MQVSARILGQEYGLTAEEMNRVLQKLGFLVGTPGDYTPTEKALQYTVEKEHHRGTGGYAHYNRDWTTRTFDDSINEVLDVSPNIIKEVRDELATARAMRYAVQAEERARADAEFLAKQAAEKAVAEAAERAALEAKEFIAKCKNAGKVGLVIAGIIVVAYGIYKITPKIKEWWSKRKSDLETESDEMS